MSSGRTGMGRRCRDRGRDRSWRIKYHFTFTLFDIMLTLVSLDQSLFRWLAYIIFLRFIFINNIAIQIVDRLHLAL